MTYLKKNPKITDLAIFIGYTGPQCKNELSQNLACKCHHFNISGVPIPKKSRELQIHLHIFSSFKAKFMILKTLM